MVPEQNFALRGRHPVPRLSVTAWYARRLYGYVSIVDHVPRLRRQKRQKTTWRQRARRSLLLSPFALDGHCAPVSAFVCLRSTFHQPRKPLFLFGLGGRRVPALFRLSGRPPRPLIEGLHHVRHAGRPATCGGAVIVLRATTAAARPTNCEPAFPLPPSGLLCLFWFS